MILLMTKIKNILIFNRNFQKDIEIKEDPPALPLQKYIVIFAFSLKYYVVGVFGSGALYGNVACKDY